MELMAACLGKRPAFLVQESPWSPSSSTVLPQRDVFCLSVFALNAACTFLLRNNNSRNFCEDFATVILKVNSFRNRTSYEEVLLRTPTTIKDISTGSINVPENKHNAGSLHLNTRPNFPRNTYFSVLHAVIC